MSDVVRDRWLAFTEPFEGGVGNWYNDIRGKTTIAYGNLCDTASEAAGLPMMHPDGTYATTAEKVAAWNRVHSDPDGARLGWRHSARLTDLRLSAHDMANLALTRFDNNERILRARVADWSSMNACARCALHSLAWACGANAYFPRLFAAVNARDFDRAAYEIHINEVTPEGHRNVGLVPRNLANKVLMLNAQRVDAYKLDPDLLEWRVILGVADAETQPDIHLPSSIPPPLPLLNTPIMEHAASHPTMGPRPLPEEVTGSGGIIHPRLTTLRGGEDDPPDDAA